MTCPSLKQREKELMIILQERGSFLFRSDFLIVEADSTIGDHKVNLFVVVKPNTPRKHVNYIRSMTC
jgi:hypothetical protein